MKRLLAELAWTAGAVAMVVVLVLRGQPWGLRLLNLPSGQSRLLIAIERGDRSGIARAVAEGADVNAVDANGSTPLVVASTGNDTAVVGELLQHGADPNQPTRLGVTPLLAAVVSGHRRNAALLLQAGADPNLSPPPASGPPIERNPLSAAFQAGDRAMAKLLISAGAQMHPQVAIWY